ncbi:hypothetical protein [Parvularcula maris]
MGSVTTLFRPVGSAELEKIKATDMRRFPPRLPEQPIFYPVTNQGYAEEIAKSWNTRYNRDGVGYVTAFDVDADYLSRFERKVVGAVRHEELWVPAEDLPEFNDHIRGAIRIVAEFRKDEQC